MKMKIPVTEQTNNYSNEQSGDHMSSNTSENNQPEEAETAAEDDFSEYLWMENEEEFDKQILQQLEEEALMEHCLEVMLDHERDLDNSPYFSSLSPDDHPPSFWSDGQQAQNGSSDLCYQMSSLRVQDKDELAKQSTLNPNAAEFVPQGRTTACPVAEKTS